MCAAQGGTLQATPGQGVPEEPGAPTSFSARVEEPSVSPKRSLHQSCKTQSRAEHRALA